MKTKHFFVVSLASVLGATQLASCSKKQMLSPLPERRDKPPGEMSRDRPEDIDVFNSQMFNGFLEHLVEGALISAAPVFSEGDYLYYRESVINMLESMPLPMQIFWADTYLYHSGEFKDNIEGSTGDAFSFETELRQILFLNNFSPDAKAIVRNKIQERFNEQAAKPTGDVIDPDTWLYDWMEIQFLQRLLVNPDLKLEGYSVDMSGAWQRISAAERDVVYLDIEYFGGGSNSYISGNIYPEFMYERITSQYYMENAVNMDLDLHAKLCANLERSLPKPFTTTVKYFRDQGLNGNFPSAMSEYYGIKDYEYLTSIEATLDNEGSYITLSKAMGENPETFRYFAQKMETYPDGFGNISQAVKSTMERKGWKYNYESNKVLDFEGKELNLKHFLDETVLSRYLDQFFVPERFHPEGFHPEDMHLEELPKEFRPSEHFKFEL